MTGRAMCVTAWRVCAARPRREDRFGILIVDSGSPEPARVRTARRWPDSYPGARLIRVDEPGVSAARNAGRAAATTEYIAYIDDDAIPAEDWVAAIFDALHAKPKRPRRRCSAAASCRNGKRRCPPWWPPLIARPAVDHRARGPGRIPHRRAAAPGSEPYACNMVVHVTSLLDAGGFGRGIGRIGGVLLSDEDVQLAWRLQDAGLSARYDSAHRGVPSDPGEAA